MFMRNTDHQIAALMAFFNILVRHRDLFQWVGVIDKVVPDECELVSVFQ